MSADDMSAEGRGGASARWSVILPFYNEEAYLGRTLETLAAQSLPPARLILVDNASTDASVDVARRFSRALPHDGVVLLHEPAPGKIAALMRGVAMLETDFVAFCDADTLYPRDYLARADALLQDPDAVAALAFGIYDGTPPGVAAALRWKGRIASLLMPHQAHSGGFGQAFRADALRAAGGYSNDRWPFMVADHEIIHRVQKFGSVVYSAQHFCMTSPRRRDRRHVDWSMTERLLYHLTPNIRKDWFFYEFLAGRFRRRGMFNGNLRRRDWKAIAG